MRVLLTGVAGFIGSNLARRLLSEGYGVCGVDHLSYGVRENVPEDLDASKARRELGWEPLVNLEEGLRRTVDFFRPVFADRR